MWFVALVLLGALVGIAAGLYLRGGGASNAKHAPVAAVSTSALGSWVATVGHPVYWAGPEHGYTYELTHTTDGRIYIRYLPAGVAVGSSAPDYLTVGTYPVKQRALDGPRDRIEERWVADQALGGRMGRR